MCLSLGEVPDIALFYIFNLVFPVFVDSEDTEHASRHDSPFGLQMRISTLSISTPAEKVRLLEINAYH